MARLLYSVTMSLDGCIAGPGGDMSWLADHLAPDPRALALAGRVGALLVGRNTWGGDDPNRGTDEEGAFSGAWTGPQIVLSHTADTVPVPVPDVTFADDLHRAVDLAKVAAGDRYVNVLGADVARQCARAGLLDEVLTFVAPVLLGDGVRLFDDPGGASVALERMEPADALGDPSLASSDPDLPPALWYRVVR